MESRSNLSSSSENKFEYFVFEKIKIFISQKWHPERLGVNSVLRYNIV